MSGFPGIKPVRSDDDALDHFSHKALAFTCPSEVVEDPGLALSDKRAILASWASDAHAVADDPTLRRLINGAAVRVDDIMQALKVLDEREGRGEMMHATLRSFSRRRPGLTRRWPNRNRRPDHDDDDDPPPCPAVAARPLGRIAETSGRTGAVYGLLS